MYSSMLGAHLAAAAPVTYLTFYSPLHTHCASGTPATKVVCESFVRRYCVSRHESLGFLTRWRGILVSEDLGDLNRQLPTRQDLHNYKILDNILCKSSNGGVRSMFHILAAAQGRPSLTANYQRVSSNPGNFASAQLPLSRGSGN